jgi:hypothetical protein
MARDRLTYRQRDLAAALKAAKAAGVSIARVEIRKDGVHIIPGKPADAPAAPEEEPDYATILQERLNDEKPKARGKH